MIFMAKKRRMPAHIVLPNGMWRFVKGKAKALTTKKAKKVRTVRVRTRRRAISMVRHRKRSYGGSKGLGLGGISLKGILVGAGSASLADNLGLTGAIPYGKYIAGGAGGKVAKTGVLSGVIGVFARDMLKGGISSGQGTVFY